MLCYVLDDEALKLSGNYNHKIISYYYSIVEAQRQSIANHIDQLSFVEKCNKLHPETKAICEIINRRWGVLMNDQGKF